jgi:hypothetical protein
VGLFGNTTELTLCSPAIVVVCSAVVVAATESVEKFAPYETIDDNPEELFAAACVLPVRRATGCGDEVLSALP